MCMTLVSMFSMVSFASEDREKVGAITLNIDASYSSGDEPDEDDFTVECSTDNVSVGGFELDYDSATKEDGESWSKYDSPVLIIYLYADDDYYFDKTSKGSFKLTGTKSEYISASKSSDKSEVTLKVRLTSLNGNIGNVYNLVWSDTSIAHWARGYNNKKYTIKLYRDDSCVRTYETTNLSYDFANDMNYAGVYYFSVRGESSSYTSDYIDSSTITITDIQANELANKVVDNSKTQTTNTSNTTNNSTNSSNNNGPSDKYGWIETPNVGWWYKNSDGSWPANAWKLINDKWYYFGADGYMVTGWKYINDKWYYMEDSGAMATGWKCLNDFWYYLDNSGAMVTGWQIINNDKYYFYPSGQMAIGADIIDGVICIFDINGVFVQ